MTLKHAYYSIAAVLIINFVGLVCESGADLTNEDEYYLESWDILDRTRILQNAIRNVIVSPKKLTHLLKLPPPIDLQFSDTEKLKESIILTESKNDLQYVNIVQLYYKGVIKEISMSDKNEVIDVVNNWIDSITDHKFHRAFETAKEISDLQQVAIFNLQYFNQTLQVNFKYRVNVKFDLTPTYTIQVPAVGTTDYFYFVDSLALDAKILKLQYSNNIAMYILLPHAKQGADELLDNLGPEELSRIQWLMDEKRVDVLLPTFKYHYTTDLQKDIQKPFDLNFNQNVRSAFGDKVDKLNIFQITALSFDGTGQQIDSYARQRKLEIFYVDRPFVFLIEDENGDVLHIGKVVNPTQ